MYAAYTPHHTDRFNEGLHIVDGITTCNFNVKIIIKNKFLYVHSFADRLSDLEI